MLGTRFRSVCRSEAGFGTPFRYLGSYAAMPGSIPMRSKLSRPECRRVSGMVPHPRTCYVRGSAGSHAGGWRLLLISPPDRTAVLRSGPDLISGISSKAQAIYFLRGRSCKITPRIFRFEAEPSIAVAPGGYTPRHSPVVHHGNAARGTAEHDDRRLQQTGIDSARSPGEVL